MITDTELIQFKEKCNNFVNLQILDQVSNNQKADTLYDMWIAATYPNFEDREIYMKSHFIPDSASLEFHDFLKFCDAREKLLKFKLKEAFPSNFMDLVNRYNLLNKLS